jgi:hypothetical protein
MMAIANGCAKMTHKSDGWRNRCVNHHAFLMCTPGRLVSSPTIFGIRNDRSPRFVQNLACYLTALNEIRGERGRTLGDIIRGTIKIKFDLIPDCVLEFGRSGPSPGLDARFVLAWAQLVAIDGDFCPPWPLLTADTDRSGVGQDGRATH